MINAIIMFVWNCLIKYIVKRCSGDFMDEVFDAVLTAFVKVTPSKVDDELLEKWKDKK